MKIEVKSISKMYPVIFSLISSITLADNVFYKEYPDEDEAQLVQVKDAESSESVMTGFVFKNKFRLSSVTGKGRSQFTLKGDLLAKLGADRFIEKCDYYKKYDLFESVHEEANTFTMEGTFYPFHKDFMASSFNGADDTQYNEVSFHPVFFGADRGEYSKSSGLTSEQVYNYLDEQIQKQKNQIWQHGKVRLTITGLDAFVCDLASKKTVLKMGTHLGFPEPLPRRTTFITSAELSTMLAKIEQRQKDMKGSKENLIINSLLQNEAMKEVLNKDFMSFGLEKYLKLSNKLFDDNSGMLKVRSLDAKEIRRTAKSLDTVTLASTSQNVIVTVEIQTGK